MTKTYKIGNLFQNASARVKCLEFIKICETNKKASGFDILYNQSAIGFDNNKILVLWEKQIQGYFALPRALTINIQIMIFLCSSPVIFFNNKKSM